MENSNPPHKRRPRYKGTHPRKFSEKYKELNPSKYSSDLQKIMSRGATPAGTHRPICVQEVLEILDPQPGQIVLDATLGYGGHARVLLSKIQPGGKLIALDQDPIERPKTEARLRQEGFTDDELVIGAVNYSKCRSFLLQNSISQVDLVLADLGLSSMQIDDPARGFTFKHEGPFDLRMNPQNGEPAWALLGRLSEEELRELLVEHSDEPHARQIAHALFKTRPATTTQVAEVVRSVVRTFSAKVREREGDTPIKRVFQALRIAVNEEFSNLEIFLEELPRIMKPGGRAAILTFHSGEDRRVKKSFQAGERSGIYDRVAPEPIRPSFEERRSNPRSKPAKLRWAIRAQSAPGYRPSVGRPQ